MAKKAATKAEATGGADEARARERAKVPASTRRPSAAKKGAAKQPAIGYGLVVCSVALGLMCLRQSTLTGDLFALVAQSTGYSTRSNRGLSEANQRQPSEDQTRSTSKRDSDEWTGLQRNLDACIAAQHEMMTSVGCMCHEYSVRPDTNTAGVRFCSFPTLPLQLLRCVQVPVDWPGFHALCIQGVTSSSISVLLHARSGAVGDAGTRGLVASATEAAVTTRRGALLDALIDELKQQLQATGRECARDFGEVDVGGFDGVDASSVQHDVRM
eukprot:1393297-Pleurochrysis_carterae.AAC.4